MSKRVSFSCDGNEFEYPITSFTSNKTGEIYTTNNYKKSRFTPASPPSSKSSSGGLSAEKFVKGVGAKMARALSFISLGKMTSRSSRKVCNSNYTSSSSSSNLGRCRSYVEPLDECHRAEAVQDCIQFFNTSSSLHKSNSAC